MVASRRDATVLITGGAGYIGAHTAKAVAERGLRPIVFDDLSSGYAGAVRWGPCVRGDVRDSLAIETAIGQYSIGSVIHFAGLIEVGRSVLRPDHFYDVNVLGTKALLDAMCRTGVRRLVFSSSAAVYGHQPGRAAGRSLDEDDLKEPVSPYGDTKLAGERLIAAYCTAFGLSAFALRYFNAAGADRSGLIGEAHHPETHLIPLAIDAALGRRPPLIVHGLDYPTPDGSCLRDYVSVSDLADAHVAALLADQDEGAFECLNLGTGHGRSVLEVITAVGRATGDRTPHSIGPRRPGDPASLVANARRANARLNWTPKCSSLDEIVETAVMWRLAPTYSPEARLAAAPDVA